MVGFGVGYGQVIFFIHKLSTLLVCPVCGRAGRDEKLPEKHFYEVGFK